MKHEPLPAQGQVDVNVSRLAWMIEETGADRPYWWNGNGDLRSAVGLTTDPNEGVRFPSREGAEFVLRLLGEDAESRFVATEHVWIDYDAARLDWLQEQAEAGCVTMCFEFDGGVHVTLDPVGEEPRAAREVNTVRDGIDHLMTANV